MELVERIPTVQEYVGLRDAVGWPSPSADECSQALAGSVAAVCVVDRGVVVGMGRLVGDGAMYCFAVDVVIDPRHQGRGLGKAVMARLEALARVRRLSARLDLVAAAEVIPFYQGLGYELLPSDLMRKPL